MSAKKMLVLFVVAAVCAGGAASADTASEIRQMIMDENEEVRKTLRSRSGLVSQDGSLEFWSSGGLLHEVTADAPPDVYDSFTIRPKHIEVITLVEGQSAVALYYSEGAMKPQGAPAVSHYMTRVMEVYVKEDGTWKIRAAHWSPVLGGAGTSQTSVD